MCLYICVRVCLCACECVCVCADPHKSKHQQITASVASDEHKKTHQKLINLQFSTHDKINCKQSCAKARAKQQQTKRNNKNNNNNNSNSKEKKRQQKTITITTAAWITNIKTKAAHTAYENIFDTSPVLHKADEAATEAKFCCWNSNGGNGKRA